ncbi:MAG: hypothetical protein JWN98_814 [Abditibacteriota bacterium]|nr:hypothetical protein [Abditibacteriota bacterium]
MQHTLPTQETRYYLEKRRPDEQRPAPHVQADPVQESIQLKRLEHPNSNLRRWLYEQVGDNWGWKDRAYWSDEEWDQQLLRPEIEIWILWLQHEPAGYFELEEEEGGSVRITHFGLRAGFMGRGLGGYLLTSAIRRAWSKATTRVWLHTSSFDHPHALANYQARGLRLIKTEVLQAAYAET